MLNIIDKDVYSAKGTLFYVHARLGWTPDNDKEHICLVGVGGLDLATSLLLLEQWYSSRSQIIGSYSSMSLLGWPLLLVIMRAHLASLQVDK